MKKIKSKQGENVKVESCPNCNEELLVSMKDGAEVFVCENCKFTRKKQ